MNLTLYIAFDKTIIKSVFQPLKKCFKSIFTATNELHVQIGQDSQYYIKTVNSTSLAHAVPWAFTLPRWAVGVPSVLRSPHSCPQQRLVRVLLSLSKAFRNSLWVFQLLPLSFCTLVSWCSDHWESRHEKDPSAYLNLHFSMEVVIPVKNTTPCFC